MKGEAWLDCYKDIYKEYLDQFYPGLTYKVQMLQQRQQVLKIF